MTMHWLGDPPRIFTAAPEDIRPVDPAQLQRLIARADRIVVTEQPLSGSPVLFASHDRADLDALARAIVTEPPEFDRHCMCIGTPCITFFEREHQIGELTNHHGHSIRFSEWDSDAPLLDSEPWLVWFEQRGIDRPRRETEFAAAESQRAAEQENRWLAAMPSCLEPVWETCLDSYGMPDAAVLTAPLHAAYPEADERIAVLFHWFGSGKGRWSGFPVYELAAEELLMQEEPARLFAVADRDGLTATQLEGAARLFAGWEFLHKRKPTPPPVPESVKERLWAHVQYTDDADKLGRARSGLR